MPAATLRIVGRRLPGRAWAEHRNVHLGLQQRQHATGLVAGDARSALFDVPIDVVVDQAKGTDYRGPFAQGKRGSRFVYLTWGDVDAAGNIAMFRRAKLNLFTVPERVARALAAGHTVQAELDLTDAKGGPLCASIAPDLIRWTVPS